MIRTLLNVLLAQLLATHLLSLAELHFPLELSGSPCTIQLEARHQFLLSVLVAAHSHILG